MLPGITGATLEVDVNGSPIVSNMSFSNGTDLTNYFTDHPISLGALNGAAFAGGIASIHVELMVTDTHGGFSRGIADLRVAPVKMIGPGWCFSLRSLLDQRRNWLKADWRL